MMNKYLIGTAAAFLSISSPAYAHGSMEPMHGGSVQMAGETMVEIVKTAKGLDVYFSDGHSALPAASFDAKLIVTPASGDKYTKTLTPAGKDRLTAEGLKPASGTKVVVSVVDKVTGAKSFATFRYK